MNDFQSKLGEYAREFKQPPEAVLAEIGRWTYFSSNDEHVNPYGVHNLALSSDLAVKFKTQLSEFLKSGLEVLHNKEELLNIREILNGIMSSFEEDGFVCIEDEEDCAYVKFLKGCPLRWFIYALGKDTVQIFEEYITGKNILPWKFYSNQVNGVENFYFSNGPNTQLVLMYWISMDRRVYVYTVSNTLYTWKIESEETESEGDKDNEKANETTV